MAFCSFEGGLGSDYLVRIQSRRDMLVFIQGWRSEGDVQTFSDGSQCQFVLLYLLHISCSEYDVVDPTHTFLTEGKHNQARS